MTTAVRQRPLFTVNRKKAPAGPVRVEIGRRSAWLYGAGVYDALEKVGTPRMRCPRHRCWTVPIDRLGDVLAHLEFGQHRRIELEEVDR